MEHEIDTGDETDDSLFRGPGGDRGSADEASAAYDVLLAKALVDRLFVNVVIASVHLQAASARRYTVESATDDDLG